MATNGSRDHHYVPQFFLRNFAVDPERKKIATVAKHGDLAVWSERSIESLGFERDFYVRMRQGTPISVETVINKGIETPISKSDTWAKIASGKTGDLDRSDKPVIYALIRHLESRTPHYLATTKELAALAASPDDKFPFVDEERDFYAHLHANPERMAAHFHSTAASLEWTEAQFFSAALSIYHSPIPLRSSSTPVHAIRAPLHPALHLPLPGMVPYQLVLTLNPTTIATLVLADFDDAFTNMEIPLDVARGFNRHFVAQFSYFANVRHLITSKDGLTTDMTWAPYELVTESERRVVYRRSEPNSPTTLDITEAT